MAGGKTSPAVFNSSASRATRLPNIRVLHPQIGNTVGTRVANRDGIRTFPVRQVSYLIFVGGCRIGKVPLDSQLRREDRAQILYV
jgi:hypothetical protein